MIYIVIIFILLYGILKYDLGRNVNEKNKWKLFNFLLVFFVLISAFAYNVGSDDESYRSVFRALRYGNFYNDMTAFLHGDYKTMPGWHFLNYFCNFLFKEYFFLRLIFSVFVNVVIFNFIKKEAKMPFVALFLYAIMIALVINFNILRQSVAVAFFLIAYQRYKEGSLWKYFLYVTLALAFHNSAIILYFVPLFSFIQFNRTTAIVFIAILVGSVIFIFTGDTFTNIMFYLINSMPSDLSNDMQYYMLDETRGYSSQFAATIAQSILLVFDIIIIWLYVKKGQDNKFKVFVVFYLLMFLIQTFFPILWRYRVYFDFFFFVAISDVLYDISKNKSKDIRSAVVAFCLFICTFPSVREYFAKNENGFRYIDQYYPYTSIFTDEKYDRN